MTLRPFLMSAFLVGAAIPAAAQDQAKVDPNVKVEFENDSVRVLRGTFPAGYTTPTHTHDLPAVTVWLTGGRRRAEDGSITEVKAKTTSYGEPNRTPHRTEFLTASESIRIELKGAGAGTASVTTPSTDAVRGDPAHHKVE